MGYIAPTWQNGGPPALNAKNMQDISDNLEYVSNNMVNPNLLDNGYFDRPVNERGQTSYSTTGDGSYTIDRWRFGGYAQTIEVTENGITWNTNTGVWWMQTIENWDALVGKTATVSALIGGNLYSVSGVVNNNDRISIAVSETVNLEISPEARGVRLVSYVETPTSVGAVLAIKLELGSQQTLAHKENGVWVLNEIPDYGEQLRRCQRYCRVYPANKAMPCIAYLETDGWYLDAALWVGDMRTAPANNLGDGIACKVQYIDGGNTYDETATNWGLLSSSMQVLRLAGTQIPSDKRAFPYVVVPQVDLVFSADL